MKNKIENKAKTVGLIEIIIILCLVALLIIISLAIAKYVLGDKKDISLILKEAKIFEDEITISPTDWTNQNVSVTINPKNKRWRCLL